MGHEYKIECDEKVEISLFSLAFFGRTHADEKKTTVYMYLFVR